MAAETEMENEVKITAEQAAGIEVVDSYALRKLTKDRENLTEVCFPDATVVDVGVFAKCDRLREANFPKCVKVEASAFEKCSSLEKVNLPLCEKVGAKAFNECSALEEIDLPLCVRVEEEAFRGCHMVELIHLPVCESIGGYAFADKRSEILLLGSSDVEGQGPALSVKLPVCKEVGDSAFACTKRKIIAVSIPVCESVGSSAFQNCRDVPFTVSPELYAKSEELNNEAKGFFGVLSLGRRFGNYPHFISADAD